MVYIIIVCVLCLLTIWLIWTNTHIKTTYYKINNKKIPINFNGYRIAEISDFHNHQWGNKLIDKLKEARPDIIVIAGDFIDGRRTNFDISVNLIKEAVKIAPVYYTTGNHESYIDNYDVLKKRLKHAGAHIIENKAVILQKGNGKINLIGIKDPSFYQHTHKNIKSENIVQKVIRENIVKQMFNIVVCHRPELFNVYSDNNVDLVFTGHAHGGQIRLPFIGGLYAPCQGWFPRLTSGVHHKNNTDMVISRGLGNSSDPVRINNTPELVIVELHSL